MNKIEWKGVELKDICEVKKGNSITRDKVTKGNVPVIAGGQQPAYYHNIANRTGETITVSGSGAYAGFVAYFNIPIFASDCSTIQTTNKEVSATFIYSFLKLKQKEIYKLQKGIAQPHIYPKDLAIIKIPLPFSNGKPDLKEQERIVSILEKVEKVKVKGDNAGKLLDEYLKSVFNEMFESKDFKGSKLKELCSLITKGTTPTTYGHAFMDKGINFLKIENIDKNGTILMNSLKYISNEANKLLKRSQLIEGDIIFSIAGALGRVAVIKKEHLPANINQAIAIIRLKSDKEIDKKYLEYYLKSERVIKQVTDNKRGVAQLNLNLEQVGNLEIILPPLPLQQKFAKIVEHVERLEENVKKTKQDSEELFNSLMTKAFRGEL